jgi:hypothetical protein
MPWLTHALKRIRTLWTANRSSVGTRIPVEPILRKLSAGMSPEAILADYPRLTLDDIDAAHKP